MTKENNKMQVDIDTLKKQNVNDLLSIKEIYRRIEELRNKITQIKYIDNTLVKKLKKEYERLKETNFDVDLQVKIINDIETINSQMDSNENKMFEELNKKRDKSDLTKMKDLSQEVKEAMSGGSVAVVGVGSTSFVNLAADLTESLGEFNSIETNMNIGFMQQNGTLNTNNYGLYYTKLDCNEGEQYSCDIRLVSSDGVLGIAFVNDEGSVISSLLSPNGSSVNEIGYKFSIPKDCKLLYLSTRNNYVNLKKVSALNVNEIKKDVVRIKDEISILPSLVNFENKNLKRRCYNLEKNNEFEWKNFDKAYFIFVIDDCNSFLPPCWDLFKSKNVPLSSATLVNTLNNIYTQYNPQETRTVKTILNDIVSNNGEILAHYAYDLYETSSYDEWNTHVRDVKIKLENEGFNIRGLIRANSTAYNTEKGEEYCRLYFDYSDGVGKSTQYNLKRKFFIGVNSLNDMKSYIDDCCNKKGIFPFCFHGNRSDEPLATTENLSLIIDYINSKGDKAKITTYEYVYDNLGTTKLEKRLIALEGK